jgi:hypothetical protein
MVERISSTEYVFFHFSNLSDGVNSVWKADKKSFQRSIEQEVCQEWKW